MTELDQRRRNKSEAIVTRRPAEHPVSVKLAVSLLTAVEALAIVDRTSPAKQIRDALGCYFETRLKDPKLNDKIAEAEKRHSDSLAVLTDPRRKSGGRGGKEKSTRRKRGEAEQSITLKISSYDFEMLSALGLLDDTTLADQLRIAVTDYVQDRRTDENLAAKIAEANAVREQTLSALG